MKALFLTAISTVFVILGLAGWAEIPVDGVPPAFAHSWTTPPQKTMRAFRSEQELATYLRELAERQKRHPRRMQSNETVNVTSSADSKAEGESGSAKDESVTNVQHAGVDEGGIVKLHGDHLVVLRRGRLFTVKIGDGALKPISIRNAFGPDIDPRSTWYDEMLISGDTIAVIGYSYERGGTEIGLFGIDGAGKLTYRSTYHLRSNDYYSSRNYASRLIGNKLIFYTPLYLSLDAEDPFQSFPAVRKWHKGATNSEFRRIVPATRVYRAERDIETGYGRALHTVTVCDLAGGNFKCEATGVLGPPGHVFYVSPQSVYVWTSNWNYNADRPRPSSLLYRMPLDGSSPSALQVSGSPVDQLSFLESDDQQLNVLVRSEAAGDGMWSAEVAAGEVALMRVPLSSFSDGSEVVPSTNYRELPEVKGYAFQNRFVGNYLLYGTGSGWGHPRNSKQASLYVVPWGGGDFSELSVKHGVDRIEAMGSDAVVIGTDGKNLHFSAIRLAGVPELAGKYIRKAASQGELRTHGFFYKPDGPGSGMLGLPISVPARAGYRHLFDSSAAILFLRNDSLQFQEVGELTARSERAIDDACRASCVDWYGNARPLFVRGRLLALLGYEIVEGTLDEGRVRESRRTNFSPRQIEITRR